MIKLKLQLQYNLDFLLKPLILKRAYKGYVYFNKLDVEERKPNGEKIDYYNFIDFSKLDFWKIKFSFRIYLQRIKKIKILYPNDLSDKMILQNIFK